MPITIIPASHSPRPHPPIEAAKSVDQLLQLSCPDKWVPNETRVVASSFGPGTAKFNRVNVYPSSASFVRSAIEAWGRHSHLVLRPEDFWFAILVQMNFYMAKHASKLRHLFV